MSSQPPRIWLMSGISGSGKSTLARNLRKSVPNTIIVSRDKLREQLFGLDETENVNYYQQDKRELHRCEKLVTVTEIAQIQSAVDEGYNVIVDDTNLKFATIQTFHKHFYWCRMELLRTDTPLDVALVRDQQRVCTVGPEVIRKQHKNLNTLQRHSTKVSELLVSTGGTFEVVQDPQLPRAIVVDVDGTLALMGNRSPFNWKQVLLDVINAPVKEAVMAMHRQDHQIIICTGRSSEAAEDTKKWLLLQEIPFSGFYIRQPSDSRPDFVVKQEMWHDIVKHHYVTAMFDDRDQVVLHARRCGFTVFQVAEGRF